MASAEEDFNSAFNLPPKTEQLQSPSAVSTDGPCQRGKSSTQKIGLTVHTSQQDFHRLKHIGTENGLTNNTDIVIFLISFYETHNETSTSRAVCRMCQTPLPVTCISCSTSPALQDCDMTCVSPANHNDKTSVLLHKYSGNVCQSPHTSTDQTQTFDSTSADCSLIKTELDSDENDVLCIASTELLQTPSSCQSQDDATDAQPVPLLSSHPSDFCPLESDKIDQSVLREHSSQNRPKDSAAKCSKRSLNSSGTAKDMTDTGRKRHSNNKFQFWQQFSNTKTRWKLSSCKERNRMFQCQSCSVTFKKRYSLKQHIIQSHKNDSPFVCQLCGQVCNDSTDLENHTRTHHTLFECSACFVTFTNDVKFKAHVRKQHPGIKPHQCQHCEKAYTSKQSLSFHCQKMHAASPLQTDGILSSDANGRYHCRACDAVFHRQSLLKVHVASHRPHIPFLCNFCGLPCHNSQRLSQHMLTHTPFKCPVCGAQFAHNTKYMAHIRKQHPGVKAHKCPHCDMAFDTRKWLAVHLLKHTGERPHLCPECGKSFTEAQVLQRHRLAMHQRSRPYNCSKCSKTFKTSSALAYHRRSHGGVKPFLCDECGKTFLCPNAFLTHKKKCKEQKHSKTQEQEDINVDSSPESNSSDMKSNQSSFLCPDCGSAFKGEQWLYRHLVNKPAACSKKFSCEFCPKVFKDNRNFVRHVRIHTGEKPFTCDVCKAKFTTRSDLYRHSRTHSGVKPYACEQCDQRFRFRCDLTTHLRTHSGETPYQCVHCDSAFISATQRLQHVRSKHKSVISAKSVKRKLKQGMVGES